MLLEDKSQLEDYVLQLLEGDVDDAEEIASMVADRVCDDPDFDFPAESSDLDATIMNIAYSYPDARDDEDDDFTDDDGDDLESDDFGLGDEDEDIYGDEEDDDSDEDDDLS